MSGSGALTGRELVLHIMASKALVGSRGTMAFGAIVGSYGMGILSGL
jgi:hypothetical protein